MNRMDRKTAVKALVALAGTAAVGAAAPGVPGGNGDRAKVRRRTAAEWAVSVLTMRYGMCILNEAHNANDIRQVGGLDELRAESMVVQEALRVFHTPEGAAEARHRGLTLEHVQSVQEALEELNTALSVLGG